MELSNSASALGLYKYDCSPPENSLFAQFYSTILDQLQSWGVTPTYIGADGSGYSGKLAKVGSRTHDKLLKSDFANVTVLSMAANPPGSEEPSYDSFVSASLSYAEASGELLACIVVNAAFVTLRSAEYDCLLRSQVNLCQWTFGYGFSSAVDKQPDFYILGLDNGKLSAEEYKSLCAWYAAQGKLRSALIRDVHPYNILNEYQLDVEVRNGATHVVLRKAAPVVHWHV